MSARAGIPGRAPLAPVLVVPGWTNSGPEHWQTCWERGDPTFRRVEQRSWDEPERDAWVAALDTAVRAAERPPVLVAHSLGCVTVAHWAADMPDAGRLVAAALLVAPADVERPGAPPALRGFAPVPHARLPFPATVVASRTDEYVAFDRASSFAAAWGAELVDAGAAGHLNAAAGFGPWPAGEQLLARLRQRATSDLR